MTKRVELVEAAKAGDRMAFGQLIDGEGRWAYGTARAILGSPSDAEDVVQDACLRAWRDLPKLRRPDNWTSWFRRIVTNAALDRARSRGRVRMMTLPEPGVERDPAERVAERDEVVRMLSTLAPEERAVLVLRFGHDLDLSEISRLLDLPLGTTKSKLHRALGKLHTIMENGYDQ